MTKREEGQQAMKDDIRGLERRCDEKELWQVALERDIWEEEEEGVPREGGGKKLAKSQEGASARHGIGLL